MTRKATIVAHMSDIQLEVELDEYNQVKKIWKVLEYGDVDDFNLLHQEPKSAKKRQQKEVKKRKTEKEEE